MNPVRLYDLAFLGDNVSRSGAPEIVVSIEKKFVTPFQEAIRKGLDGEGEEVVRYLEKKETRFVHFEGGRYGYGGCASISEERRGLDIHVELRDFWSRHTALTLQATFFFLTSLFRETEREGERPPDESQYIEVHLSCEDQSHGHSAFGWIFTHFGKWLLERGREYEEGRRKRSRETQVIAVIENVVSAMTSTWGAVAPPELKRWKDRASLFIQGDGRFFLTCFGDACDLGIYPDGLLGEHTGQGMNEFASHNLDSHVQQLTLLSGLAVLAEKAREDGERR